MENTFHMKKFVDELGINGHLTIIKRSKDGQEEVLYDDHNIIVSGMGVGLSYMFTGSGSNTILDYQIDRFQVGTSGNPVAGPAGANPLEVSTTYTLSGPLGNEYGAGSNLFIEQNDQLKNGLVTADQYFPLIPANKRTRIGDVSVRYTLVLDEEACNDLVDNAPLGGTGSLNEVGLFMKNPRGQSSPQSILVAYKTFSNIYKTSDFSLIFRWTLNF
jgi:hypothetical protein